MTRFSLLGMMLLTALALYACDASDTKVRSPHWGKDTCKVCRMAITEKQPAAQLVGPGAQVSYYDDLGCAVNAMLTDKAPADAKLYVVAPGTQEDWVAASKVRFETGAKTPMDYGYLPSDDGTLSIDQVTAELREEHGERWRVPEAK